LAQSPNAAKSDIHFSHKDKSAVQGHYTALVIYLSEA
jgi:hypothetical protein